MRTRSSLGVLLALAACGGCTTIVGLDDVSYTGAGGSGASGGGGAATTSSTTSAGGDGGDTMNSSVSAGGGGAGTTSSSTSNGGGGAGTTSSSSTGTTSTPTIVCGDGDLDGPEECEDGNTTDGDGCSSECMVEPFYQCVWDDGTSKCKPQELICNDGIDNDGDAGVDADDPDCALPPSFTPCQPGQKLHVYKPLDVPDSISDEAKSSVFVADHPIIVRAAVTFTATHADVDDVEADLTRYPGGKVDLFTFVGGSGDNFTATVLDSTCATAINQGTAPFTGCYKPEDSFSFLAGVDGHAEWELKLKDEVSFNTGTLEDWALLLCVE